MSAAADDDKSIEVWKIKKLVKSLAAARGCVRARVAQGARHAGARGCVKSSVVGMRGGQAGGEAEIIRPARAPGSL